jgi:hypothetical protein
MASDFRSAFESALRDAASLQVGTAGPDDEQELGLIREAMEYLREHPDIAGGDPDGDFTYEHPVLALAAYGFREGRLHPVGTAGDGSELTNFAIIHWAIVAIQRLNAIIHDKDVAELKARVPKEVREFKTPALHLALLGDAGYKGIAQTKVLDAIRARHDESPFDLVIHLGDTYFGGSPAEVLSSLLDPLRDKLPGAEIASLCGNHDLYYGCGGYLSALKVLGQKGRYFAIESPSWRVACLDTTLAALGFRRNDGLLDVDQLDWLNGLAAHGDRKPLVLLSHHYIRSHWHSPIESLRRQLADWAKTNVFAWYWGHEHHFAAYGRGDHGYYGGCVGNGAFLEAWSPSRTDWPDMPNWHAPEGCRCYGQKGVHAWPHGFLELELDGDAIAETYHLEWGEPYRRTIRRPAG